MGESLDMVASALKDQGNAELSKGNIVEAIMLYNQAIDIDPENHVLYSNRSVAYVKVQKYNEALADGEKTISIKPDWGKGYFRKGTALSCLSRFEEAEETFEKGLEVEPNNFKMKDALEDCRSKTSLPFGWEMRKDLNGKPYYINHYTKTSTFVKPPAPAARPPRGNSAVNSTSSSSHHNTDTRQHFSNSGTTQMNSSLPDGWEERKDANGRPYYINHVTKTTQWVPPAPASVPGEDPTMTTTSSSSHYNIDTSQHFSTSWTTQIEDPTVTITSSSSQYNISTTQIEDPTVTITSSSSQYNISTTQMNTSPSSSSHNINISEPHNSRQPIDTSQTAQTSNYQPYHLPSLETSLDQIGLAKGPDNSLLQGSYGIYVRGPDPTLRKGPSGLAKGSQLFQGIRSDNQPRHGAMAKGPDSSLRIGPSSISARGPDPTLHKGPAGLAKGSQLYQGIRKEPLFSSKNL